SVKKYNKEVLKSTMRSLWRTIFGFKIREVGSNLFLFIFNNNDDREKVLKLGPWWFDKQILLLEKLEEETHPSNISLYKASIWIRVFGVPFLCLSENVGRVIGNSIGKIEEIGVVAGRRDNNQYLRLRVGIDVLEPLRRRIKFMIGSQEKIWLSFKYEKLPNFCHFCGKLRHTVKKRVDGGCHARGSDDEDMQYGPWLTVESYQMGSYSPRRGDKDLGMPWSHDNNKDNPLMKNDMVERSNRVKPIDKVSQEPLEVDKVGKRKFFEENSGEVERALTLS
ncbi:DUF4283 domain-containing protein/zf-CCHC_4 domain-containing protein, partial [Cephalotus follicularis]